MNLSRFVLFYYQIDLNQILFLFSLKNFGLKIVLFFDSLGFSLKKIWSHKKSLVTHRWRYQASIEYFSSFFFCCNVLVVSLAGQ